MGAVPPRVGVLIAGDWASISEGTSGFYFAVVAPTSSMPFFLFLTMTRSRRANVVQKTNTERDKKCNKGSSRNPTNDPSAMSPGGSACNCMWPALLSRRSQKSEVLLPQTIGKITVDVWLG